MTSYDFELLAGNSGTISNEAGLELALKTTVSGDRVPLDLQDDEIVFVARPSPRPPPALRMARSTGQIIVVADQGRILIPFSAAETRALGSPDKIVAMRYEVERRPAGGGQRTVLAGVVTILPGVNDD